MNAIVLFAGIYLLFGVLIFAVARSSNAAKRDPTFFLLVFSLCLWPWLLYLLWDGWPQARRSEEKKRAKRLRKHRCGALIEYRPYPHEGSCSGIFRFAATDFELIVKNYAPRNSELLQWLRNRDDSIKCPVEIPGMWNLHWLSDAIEKGYSKIFCTACGAEIESFRKETEAPKVPSWSATYFCPKGHVLYRRPLGYID